MKSKKLTLFILLGMVLGIATGLIVRSGTSDAAGLKSFVDNISMLTDIFLRLIKMIIAPLVFTTLVAGIARMGDAKSVGRVGGKTLMWFISASLLSLTLGLIMVNLLKPGVAVNLPLPDLHADSGIKASAMSVKDFITHAFPKSVFDAMANNEILQIVVFSLFFGSACAALGERAKLLVDLMDVAAHVMLKVTGYVMMVAPVAVFAALAATVAKDGLAILGTYGKFLGEFYLSILLLWTVLIVIGSLFVGPRVLTLVRSIREPILLAFSTASSEAAYPKTLEQLERFGVSNKIASFVLPVGYSFNLDGSMMYCTFATIFLAQAFNIPLTLTQEITMLLMFMVTSKGMAGVPRASLVVIAAMLPQFNIPEAGLLLILGIDHFLDMGRSATNVMGNSIATAVVAKWENELKS
ncbi:MAG: dicarboxylate/amino acid:cation symporter [Paludibacterium sp.]|uniref:dicarboxylate/amino acid:cation symporter n=1 Tax=Paludibacterium sp. TaxID=1917523 RepID=UPI0025E5F5F8|nr:dicarboxylate/amino acid:cation symporter [Paludibacterium sp.]MBV8048565.1 dicarboxylate/amino acid:cation symporter [Paludibacterium sp.]MBV8648112.1 dicarboxylate/amino acid:cation symporter [Paludibacterium sp.]